MQTNTKHQVYAGFFVRLAAFLVDMIIVNTGLMVVRLPMWILSLNSPDNILVRDFIFEYSVVDIVKYLLTVLYFILLTYYTGSTLGKKLFQIRVISVEERKMTFFEVAYRETIGRFLSAIVMQLGYLLVIVQKEHRGVHDLLSDTCVIYYHEKKVYVHTQMNYRNMAPNPGYTVPPNVQQNGNMPSNNPAPNGVTNGVTGSVPPGYFSSSQMKKVTETEAADTGQAAEKVSEAGMPVEEKPEGSTETVMSQSPEMSTTSPNGINSQMAEGVSSGFVRPGEEPESKDIPFERNE